MERDDFFLDRALVRVDFPARDFTVVFLFDPGRLDARARDAFAPFPDLAGFFLDLDFDDVFAGRLVAANVAGRVARAPIAPPTTVPTGPARLPMMAPAAAPATGLGIGGMCNCSDSCSSGITCSFRFVRMGSKSDSRDKALSAVCDVAFVRRHRAKARDRQVEEQAVCGSG